jgi:hypothetical protein
MRGLLLGILFTIVALCAFIARRWTSTESAGPTAPPVPETVIATDGAGAKAALDAAPDRGGAIALQSPAQSRPGADVPLDDRDSEVPDDEEFAARYAGWSKAKLEEHLGTLESAFLVEVDQLCDQRFDAGQFRVVDAAEVEGLDDSYDVLSPYDAQGMLTRSRMVAREDPPAESPESEVEATFEYHIATLPPDSFPETYRRVAELQWLRARVAAEDPQ